MDIRRGAALGAWRGYGLAVALVLIGGLLVVGRGGAPAMAQDGTPTATTSGFVGAWRVVPRIGDEAAVALTSFTRDGLIITSNRPVQPVPAELGSGVLVQSLGQGSWEATSATTADITFVILQSAPDGTYLGTRTIRGALTLDPSGDAWSGTFAVEIANAAGAIVHQATGEVRATRIEVDPAAAITPAATPVAAGPPFETVELGGDVDRPFRWTVDQVMSLSSVPPQEATVTWESASGSETRTFRGVSLYELLIRSAPRFGSDEAARATTSVVVTGWDGYQAVLSWGELDPALGGDLVLLAYEENRQPLAVEHQPFHVVVTGDAREDRSVWGVVSIEIRVGR